MRATPPLDRSGDRLPEPTPFVGREVELAQIARLLDSPTCRMLTLLGPGGIGKSRLSFAAARAHRDAFDEGVCLVSLQSVSSPDFFIPAVAEALGFQFYSVDEPKQQLLDHLSDKSLLLVLDSFEHLVTCAGLVSEMLAEAPALKVLVTSRERLNLVEEWVLEVPGLPLPASDHQADIEGYGAVQLFLQSAERAQVGFRLADAQKPAAARICRLVGGMPLGIELAAAWVRALSCEEIAAEIEHSLDILATAARNMPPRHRTMRAVLDHSWHLLTDAERDVFPRLSVFRGGFRREAAREVAGAGLPTLSALVDKSLLTVDGSGRYALHELVRQYAREKLEDASGVHAASDRHRDYYADFAERMMPDFPGANQIVWLNRVEAELGNVRAAIRWAVEHGDIAAGLRLTSSLFWFWALYGYHREGFEQLMSLLSLPAAQPRTVVRARSLNAAGVIQWFEGNYPQARALLEEASAVAREVADDRELALSIRFLGHVLYIIGDSGTGAAMVEHSLTLARRLEDRFGLAWSLHFLGDLALHQGDAAQARKHYEESILLMKTLNEIGLLGLGCRRLGFVLREAGDHEQARALCRESLELNAAMGDRRGVAACLVGLAGVAIAQGEAARAVWLLGSASRLLSDINANMQYADQREYERHLAHARSQLDAQVFEQAWSAGQSMTMEQAVSDALNAFSPPPEIVDQTETDGSPDLLSARELEILHLMADGMSNREIAARLFLSVGTVKWYGSQICSKLQARSRVQAIARARELKLLR